MKLIIKILGGIIFLLAALFFFAYYKVNHTITPGDLKSNLTYTVEKRVQKANLVGVVVGVLKNGQVRFYEFGQVAPGSNQKPRPDSAFQIGSLSKLFTAQTAHALHDEGVLSLDDTLEKLVQSSAVPIDSKVKDITLRQLITHTSGLPSIPQAIMDRETARVGREKLLLNPYLHITKNDILSYLSQPDDAQKPGKFEYSNYGMGLAGQILEMKTGKSLENLVAEKILNKLEMKSTAIQVTEAMKARLVPGFNQQHTETPYWQFTALEGAGAFYSTAEDMMKFVQSQLPAPKPGGWIEPDFLHRFFGNKDVVWHNGLVGGFASYLSVDPKNQTGVIILSNKSIDLTMLGSEVTQLVRIHSLSVE